MKCLDTIRVKWIDIESTLKTISFLKYTNNILVVICEKDETNGSVFESLLMNVKWNPCLRVELMQKVQGRVCAIKMTMLNKLKIHTIIDQDTIGVMEL